MLLILWVRCSRLSSCPFCTFCISLQLWTKFTHFIPRNLFTNSNFLWSAFNLVFTTCGNNNKWNTCAHLSAWRERLNWDVRLVFDIYWYSDIHSTHLCLWECTMRIQHNKVHVRISQYAIYTYGTAVNQSIHNGVVWVSPRECVRAFDTWCFFSYFVEWFSVQCLYAFCNWYCVKTIHTHRRTYERTTITCLYLSLSTRLLYTPSIKSRSEFMMWMFFSFCKSNKKMHFSFYSWTARSLIALCVFFCVFIYRNTELI